VLRALPTSAALSILRLLPAKAVSASTSGILTVQ
jgi:hypothetical protein